MRVTWDENVCIHAGKCVSGAPEVFKIEDGQFKIYADAAPEEKVREVVGQCPSGALRIQD